MIGLSLRRRMKTKRKRIIPSVISIRFTIFHFLLASTIFGRILDTWSNRPIRTLWRFRGRPLKPLPDAVNDRDIFGGRYPTF
jgi:hypothetical protein